MEKEGHDVYNDYHYNKVCTCKKCKKTFYDWCIQKQIESAAKKLKLSGEKHRNNN